MWYLECIVAVVVGCVAVAVVAADVSASPSTAWVNYCVQTDIDDDFHSVLESLIVVLHFPKEDPAVEATNSDLPYSSSMNI